MALYKKELRRLFTCSIYAMNSGFGAVLFVAAGVGLMFAGNQFADAYFEMENFFGAYMHCAPFAMAIIVALNSTTCVALSLEGKNRWIACSVPVGAKTIFDSKILVHLTVFLPACVIGAPLWILALKPAAAQIVFMMLIPLIYAAFVGVAGMYVDCKNPRYDWASEYYCVKGSMNVVKAVGIGLGTSIAPLILCAVFPGFGIAIEVLTAAALTAVTVVLYRRLGKAKLHM